MKKCNECGFDNDDEMRFCGKCGAVLKSAAPEVCAKCGAELKPDMNFCGKCGAKVEVNPDPFTEQLTKCPVCGAVNSPDAVFCGECGKPMSAPAQNTTQTTEASVAPQTVTSAPQAKPQKSFKAKANEAKSKVLEFEKKHSVIVNGIVAVLAFIFLFVALFCPIKITQTDINALSGDSASVSAVDSNNTEISQSIWQVFDSIGYLGLDPYNAEDMNKIRNAMKEYEAAYDAAELEFKIWYQFHLYVSDMQAEEKWNSVLAEHLSDVNYLGTILSLTTVGALDKIMVESGGEPMEAMLADILDTARKNAIITLVFALITAVAQLFVAIVSLIFFIFALVGMVRKKTAKLFKYMTMALIGSGAGLVMTMIGPLLAPSGAVFGIALTFALLYLIFGVGKAFIEGKGVLHITKRAVYSVAALIAVFLLCSTLLNSTMIMEMTNVSRISQSSIALGGTVDIVISCTGLLSMPALDVEIFYSDLSIASALAALIIGIIAFTVLFTAMLLSLRKLAFKTESKSRVDAVMLVGIIALLLLAILPAALGAADSLPYNSLLFSSFVAMQVKISANAFVYVAIAFAVFAFVWELAFRPKNKIVNTAETIEQPITVTNQANAQSVTVTNQ